MLSYSHSRLGTTRAASSASSSSTTAHNAASAIATSGSVQGSQCSCSHRCTTLPRTNSSAWRWVHKARRARADAVSSDYATSTQEAALQLEFASPAAGRFSDDRKVFVEEHRIRGNEVGPDQYTSVVTMANILQEVASNHAVALWGRATDGFARIPELMDHIFVMSRLQIRMERFPRWGDIIRLETFFAEDGRLLVRRDWNVTGASTGEHLGSATSSWVTINTSTRKLCKLIPSFRAKYLPYSPGPDVAFLPAGVTKRKLPDMNGAPTIEGPVQVARRSDMDMNGHINNVTYLAWSLETVPDDIYCHNHLKEIEVDFKAECQAGDTVDSLGNPLVESVNGNGLDSQFLHVIRRCDDEGCRELVRARTTWSERARSKS